VVSSIRNDKEQYQKQLVRKMKSCLKMFYSYIRSKQRSAVSRVYNANGDLTQNDSETAKTLCDQFQKVFVDNSGDDLLHYVSNFQSSNNELSAHSLPVPFLRQIHTPWYTTETSSGSYCWSGLNSLLPLTERVCNCN